MDMKENWQRLPIHARLEFLESALDPDWRDHFIDVDSALEFYDPTNEQLDEFMEYFL